MVILRRELNMKYNVCVITSVSDITFAVGCRDLDNESIMLISKAGILSEIIKSSWNIIIIR